MNNMPKIIAFEVTNSCRFNCLHCRANAVAAKSGQQELTTAQCKKILASVSKFCKDVKPIIILTGGEPMERGDIYELIRYGRGLGLRMVMATCGYLIDEDSIAKLKEAGVLALSFSIDGSAADSHDKFRDTAGAFDTAVRAAEVARKAGMRFQINTTISKINIDEIAGIVELAKRLGAYCFNAFILVPTGRGRRIADEILSPLQYEVLLNELLNLKLESKIEVRVTCGPQFARVWRDTRGDSGGKSSTRKSQVGDGEQVVGDEQVVRDEQVSGDEQSIRGGDKARKMDNRESIRGEPNGCMGGKGFGFISWRGDVQTCGFLDISAGNLVENGFNFGKIWRESKLLNDIRDVAAYKGKCGVCEYVSVCGGCRARAYATTGDYLAADPVCEFVSRRS